MPAFCSCSAYGANTGGPESQNIIDTGVKLVFVRLVADDGTVNSILSTDTLDSTFLNAKLNHVDKSKRWYPIGAFADTEDNREDPTYQEFSDGSRDITNLGRRTWTGFLRNVSSRYLAKMESWFCQRFGLYEIDNCGNLVGSISADGTELFPSSVNNKSFASILQKGTFTVAGGVRASIDFSTTMKDKDLRMIKASDISVDLLGPSFEGLRDVTSVISSITTTGLTATLTLPFDGFGITDPAATGWVLADFDLYNVTDSASIAITSVTEGADGVYAFVIPTQDSADVLRLRSSKNGFDMGDVSITIP